MLTVWGDFQAQTSINPDYFLSTVLKFIYPYNGMECIGDGNGYTAYCIDEKGIRTAMICVTEDEFKITRIENVAPAK